MEYDMRSAKELKKALLNVGHSPDEVEAIVQKGISEGKLDNDIEVQAVPEEVFAKALSAIDAALNAKEPVAKSDIEAAAAAVESVAKGEPASDAEIRGRLAAIQGEVAATQKVLKSCMVAIKDMFVAITKGINASTQASDAALGTLTSAVQEVQKSLVGPKAARPVASQPAPAFQAQVAQAVGPSSSEEYVMAKHKLVSLMKSETQRSDVSPERRAKLALGFTSLAGARDMAGLRRIASDLGLNLDA